MGFPVSWGKLSYLQQGKIRAVCGTLLRGVSGSVHITKQASDTLLLSILHFTFLLTLSPSRCYNKTNGTFSSGTLPLMHRVPPCQQDGLEMVPLGQVPSQCHSSDLEADVGYEPDEHKESSPLQHSCCLIRNIENSSAESTGETVSRQPWGSVISYNLSGFGYFR